MEFLDPMLTWGMHFSSHQPIILRHLQGCSRIRFCIPQEDTVILNYASICLEIAPKIWSYKTGPPPSPFHSHTHMHTQVAAASGNATLLPVPLSDWLWVRGFRGHVLGFN